jgi:hypothetical protein
VLRKEHAPQSWGMLASFTDRLKLAWTAVARSPMFEMVVHLVELPQGKMVSCGQLCLTSHRDRTNRTRCLVLLSKSAR